MGRVDKEDKKRRIDELEIEMIWVGSHLPGLMIIYSMISYSHFFFYFVGKYPSIFTGITYNTFDPPPFYDKDDIDSEDYNVEERVGCMATIAILLH